MPLVLFATLTALNGLFWLAADFRSFAPSSEGTLVERLFMFGITEVGPFASFLVPMHTADYVWAGAIGLAIITFAILSWRYSKSWVLAVPASTGVVVWFMAGLAVTGLRIT